MPKLNRGPRNIFDGIRCVYHANHSLADWSPEVKQAIIDALADGGDFTTGWYRARRQSASCRITRRGNEIEVEVHTSDGDDNEGRGYGTTASISLDDIIETIDATLDSARENLEDNMAEEEADEDEDNEGQVRTAEAPE